MDWLDVIGASLNTDILKLLSLIIVLDYLTGISAALINQNTTSKKMIDGLIRKGNMIVTVIICCIFDFVVQIDFLSILSVDATLVQSIKSVFEALGMSRLGMTELIGVGFLLGEMLSVLENLEKCDIKVFKFLKESLKKITSKLFNAQNN